MTENREITRASLNACKKRLRSIRKELKAAGNYRLAAEAAALIREKTPFEVHFLGDEPLMSAIADSAEELTTEGLCAAIAPYTDSLSGSDFLTLSWQLKYRALCRREKNAADLFYSLGDIDEEYINSRFNPLCIKFSADEGYNLSDRATKSLYMIKTIMNASATGIKEERLSSEYMRTAARSGTGVGEVIFRDFRRIFPHTGTAYYIVAQTALAVGITALAIVISGWIGGLAVFTPALGVSKTIIDRLLLKSVVGTGVAAVKLSEAEKHKIVCALSALVNSEDGLYEALERLKQAKIRNNTDNIKWCLLCDFSPSDNPETEKDKEILSAAEKYSISHPDSPVIIFRRREFSKTQGKYQGRERKRGAVEALIRFISGEEQDFRRVFGNASELRNAPFVCALDYDTLPLMDSINSLAAAALHPINSEYGIFAPRITTSLSSSLRTGLSRLFGGVGGCSGASVYDSFSPELYYDCFGEGTFTGKGLIRTEAFMQECAGALPEEKILSHDILEGGLLGVAYCGGCEFSDSFPPTTKGYFKRQHRWLRGDFQNFLFIFDSRFFPLTRFKLADNIRRALNPFYALLTLFISAVSGTVFPAIIALLSVALPYLIGLVPAALKGLGFSNTREFYSPITSLSRQLFSQLFWEIIFLPKNAVLSADAFLRTFFRMLRGKKLLEWQTASQFDKTGAVGYEELILPTAAALLLFILSVYFGNIFTGIAALLMAFQIPAAMTCDIVTPAFTPYVKEEEKKRLLEQAEKQWQFYEDYVTKEDNYLPPDNVQYSPVYRVARRTSPTNIGMYLLSCVCAKELGLIDRARAENLIEKTLDTVEKMEKYRGNLYNWYKTDTLEPLGDFVSSVDSGNFLCCLTAVKQELISFGNFALAQKAKSLIDRADISVFYNRPRNLFSVGLNAKTGKTAPNCYDMLMSEARMLSFFAIATGKADKSHWRALSRIMSRNGKYAGPVAWTGTMFEYFMPELLLESKKGSLCYEALNFAVYCQRDRGKSRRLPFGISESGYFAFDRELNYQYKAHGVQKLALCGGMDKEYVISPYSTFLALSHSFSACMANLSRLDIPRFTHEKYGFYEAVDLTGARTGGEAAVVKSHMAHHIGMSLGGITNALCGGKLRELFMSDPQMQRAEELLEERVMSGEVVIDIEKIRDKTAKTIYSEEYTDFSVLRPRIGVVANRKLSVFAADTGLYCGRYGDKATAVTSPDFLRRPKGMFFGFYEKNEGGTTEIPLYVTMYDKGANIKRSTVFGQNSAEYYADYRGLNTGMKLSLFGENAAEIREIAAENTLQAERKMGFYANIEPALQEDSAYSAHPAFAQLFIKAEYDKELCLAFVHRKERHSDREIYMCLGFKDNSPFDCILSRENVLEHGKPLDFSKALSANADERTIPTPCVFMKLEFSVAPGEKFENTLFICYGESRNEVIGIANDIRNEVQVSAAISPLPESTLQGQLARRALPAILYKNVFSREILSASGGLDRRALWKFGISGDKPIVLFRSDGDEAKTEAAALMAEGLCECGVPTDLVIICQNEKERDFANSLHQREKNCIFPLLSDELTDRETALITKSASYVLGKTEERKPPAKIMEFIPCEQDDSAGREGFKDDGYVISEKGHPLCNVLASREFGCVLSQNSLGFSYAMNSRENKLTPWYNDVMQDNDGEMLLIKGNGCYYDIISGARAVFSPDKADYYGKLKKLSIKTEVRVFEKGMGKQLTVIIENNSDSEKTCALSYYTEPVMGADLSAGGYGAALMFENDEHGIYVSNSFNPEFKGEMGVWCDKEIVSTANREQFLAGEQNGEAKPFARCCAAVTARVKIPAHSTEKTVFILAYSRSDVRKMIKALQNVGTEWKKERSPIIKSGDDTLDRLYNYWLPWQTLGCRMWARSGFYQNGGAYGFRDQLQDGLGAIAFMPTETKRQILRCCASQFEEGDVLHWWHRTNRGRKGVRTKYSDDMLWLPFVTAAYCRETGDKDILRLSVQYIKGDELGSLHEKYMEVESSFVRENVYCHCKKALEKCYKTGVHGLIKIGCGDWNDGFNNVGIDGRGESVWLSMFYVRTVKDFAPIAREIGEENYAAELEKQAAELTAAIEENAFENGYYLRAFYDSGEKMGGLENECCKIDLLPQAFAELAALPDGEKRKSALKKALEVLVSDRERLIKLFTPAFDTALTEENPGYVRSYPPGIRENGGQYTHAAVWLALAVLRSGDRDTAMRLTDYLNPAKRGAEFKNEPYYMTADIYTNPECIGRGGWSLYTGAAGWYYRLLWELFGDKTSE